LERAGYIENWVDPDEDVFWTEEEEAFYGDEHEGLKRICGVLWNCSDIMPADLCQDLDLSLGSTYARAARMLRQGG
jgi:hypothetical protein